MTGNYYSAAIILAVIGIIVFFLFRRYYQLGKERDSYDDQLRNSLKEILSRDNQIKKLNIQHNHLVSLNGRYLAFILKFPTILHRLNSTSKLKEIALSIIELVKDLIVADTADLYMLDSSNSLLRKLSVDLNGKRGQVVYKLGEGMIGMAGEQRFIIMREHYKKLYAKMKRR